MTNIRESANSVEGLRMSIRNRVFLVISVLLFGGLFIGGCGSSTTNDQGTSFLALGYLANSDGSLGLTGIATPINRDVAANGGAPFPLSLEVDVEDGIQPPFIGLENRLTEQFINVSRVDCDYDVPGGSVAVPSDSFALALNLAPRVTGDDDAAVSGGSQAFAGFELISPDILAFLNASINSLPELPFRVVINCRAVGVSQAGDQFVTNDIFFQWRLIEDPLVTTPASGGNDLGGSFESFGEPAADTET